MIELSSPQTRFKVCHGFNKKSFYQYHQSFCLLLVAVFIHHSWSTCQRIWGHLQETDNAELQQSGRYRYVHVLALCLFLALSSEISEDDVTVIVSVFPMYNIIPPRYPVHGMHKCLHSICSAWVVLLLNFIHDGEEHELEFFLHCIFPSCSWPFSLSFSLWCLEQPSVVTSAESLVNLQSCPFPLC